MTCKTAVVYTLLLPFCCLETKNVAKIYILMNLRLKHTNKWYLFIFDPWYKSPIFHKIKNDAK